MNTETITTTAANYDAGWYCDERGTRAVMVSRVETAEDLNALPTGGTFLSDADAIVSGRQHPTVSGLVLVTLPYSWGDQPAAHYAVYHHGVLIDHQSGTGDLTPEPITTEAGWKFTCTWEEAQVGNGLLVGMFRRGQSPQWAEVGVHLGACYRRKLNPLPTLRREHPGKWEFVAPAKVASIIPNASAIAWEGADGITCQWVVVYTPKA